MHRVSMAGSPPVSLAEQAQVKLITVTDDLVQQLAEHQMRKRLSEVRS